MEYLLRHPILSSGGAVLVRPPRRTTVGTPVSSALAGNPGGLRSRIPRDGIHGSSVAPSLLNRRLIGRSPSSVPPPEKDLQGCHSRPWILSVPVGSGPLLCFLPEMWVSSLTQEEESHLHFNKGGSRMATNKKPANSLRCGNVKATI